MAGGTSGQARRHAQPERSLEIPQHTMTLTRSAKAWLAGALLCVVPELAHAQTYDGPRTTEGHPDLSGIWQVLGSAAWDLEGHNAQDGIPAGLSVVDGGTIPYTPAAAARCETKRANRRTDDPVRKCFLPGVPRITSMPWPFQIVQTPDLMVMSYEYAHTVRLIYTDGSPHPLPKDFWMGDSRGHWADDTLVVDTTQACQRRRERAHHVTEPTRFRVPASPQMPPSEWKAGTARRNHGTARTERA